MKRPFALSGLLALGGLAASLALAGCPSGPPPNAADNTDAAPGGTTSSTGEKNTAAAGTYAAVFNLSEEPESVAGTPGGILRTANISDPKTFNLWVAAETSSTVILAPLYEPMNDRNQYTLKFEPKLAELPKISEDGLTYTYTLRPNLVWSDGRPLTTDDVIFTLDMIFDEKVQGNFREGMLIDVPQPDGTMKREPFKYRKIDKQTVEFKLPVKYAPAEAIFSFNIAPKHKLEAAWKAGQPNATKFNEAWNTNTNPKELVSNGAWIISEYVPAQRVVYQRNPRYYQKAPDDKPLPYLEKYTYLIVPDLNTTVLKFRSGDTDMLGIPTPEYPKIKADEAKGRYEVINRGPAWGFSYLGFNMNPNAKLDKVKLSLFRNVKFRQAVSHAVNRERMVEDIFLGLAEPSYGPVPTADRNFYKPDVPKFAYDLDKAKALLAEIGLKDTNGNGILEYEGKDVTFNILTNVENDIRKSMATIVADDLKKVGLDAKFTPVNFNDLIRRLNDAPFEWEAVILGFTGGPEPHEGQNIWRSEGNLHQWYPKQKKPDTPWEAEIDKIFIQAAQELDLEKRKALYGRWQQIVAEQQPLIFLTTPEQLSAMDKGFGNIKPASLGGLLWNLEEIFKTNGGDAKVTAS